MLSSQSKSILIFTFLVLTVSFSGFAGFWIISDSLLSQHPLAIENDLSNSNDSFKPIADYTYTNPSMTVYPQYRFEYLPINVSVRNGKLIDTPRKNGYMLSDDTYAILTTQNDNLSHSYRTLDNFYYITWLILPKKDVIIRLNALGFNYQFTIEVPGPIWDTIGMIYFYYRISPELSTFISVDDIIDTKGYLYNESHTDNFYGKIVAANSEYLYPHPSSYYEFRVTDGVTSKLEFEATTGGLRFFNDTMYSFYESMWRAKRIVDKYINEQISLITYFAEYFQNLVAPKESDIRIVSNDLTIAIWMQQNPIMYDFFNALNPTYEDFLDFMGCDINRGFNSFIRFDPYAVTKISGKIQLYIDMPQENPNLPYVNRYHVQLWNYYTGEWNDVLVRQNTLPIQLTNTWLYDSFYIDANCWQYCHPLYDLENTSASLRWRVVVDTTRGEGDIGDIRVRFGGIWSSFTSEFIDFSMSFDFRVENENITVFDLLADPVFYFEYHTDGWQSIYEGVTISKPVLSYFEMIYSAREFILDFLSDTSFYVNMILNEGIDYFVNYISDNFLLEEYSDIIFDPYNKIKNMPSRDERIGYSINRMIVAHDTFIRIGVNGRFAKYDRDGNLRDPKLYIDKATMQYEYKTPIEVSSKTYINMKKTDYAYTMFEINVTDDVVNLELPIKQDMEFLSSDFSLVESPTFKNISYYWWDSMKTDLKTGEYLEQPLFDANTIRFSAKIFFFEGSGTYRVWCKIPNYAESVNIYKNSTYTYSLYERIVMEQPINYTMKIRNLYDLQSTNFQLFNGTQMTIDIQGYSSNGKSIVNIPRLYGNMTNYTVGGTTYYNMMSVNYTHLYTDNMWGTISYSFHWMDADGWKHAWYPYLLTILRVSLEPPIISVIDPSQGTRWGASKVNYAVVAAWHSDTIGVYIRFDGWNENISLIRLSEAMNNPEIDPLIAEYGIPLELFNIPISWRDFYWLYPIEGEELAFYYPNDGSGERDITANIWGESLVGSTIYTSDAISVDFKLVHKNNFNIFPVYDISVGQKIRLQYYCPDGIDTITLYLQDDTGMNTKLVVLGNGTSTSFLYEGYQTYTIPFRFTYEGEFRIFIEVYDDLENYDTYTTNTFRVINTDTRPWYVRLIDEGIQLMILWTSFTASTLGLGIVMIKKKSEKPITFIYKMPSNRRMPRYG